MQPMQDFKLDQTVSSIQGASVDISQAFLPYVLRYPHTQFFFPAFLYVFCVYLVYLLKWIYILKLHSSPSCNLWDTCLTCQGCIFKMVQMCPYKMSDLEISKKNSFCDRPYFSCSCWNDANEPLTYRSPTLCSPSSFHLSKPPSTIEWVNDGFADIESVKDSFLSLSWVDICLQIWIVLCIIGLWL